MPAESPLLVIGAGSWGTALALAAARGRSPVRLWGRDSHQIAEIARTRENARFLEGITLPPGIELSADLRLALDGVSEVLIAVPGQALREIVVQIAGAGRRSIAWACKGFEQGSGRLFDRVVAEIAGAACPLAVVSGPTFAHEVAAGLPAAITIGASDMEFGKSLVRRLHSDLLRAYITDDMTGVQVGGAIKNVIAIAAGIADGLGLGANCRAALITRGLAEISRFGARLGGRTETFMGLSGLGDLVLTCTDNQSRNRRLGLHLAQGEPLAVAMPKVATVIEGVTTARTVTAVAGRLGIEMPIAAAVTRVLDGQCTAAAAVRDLLARDPAHESNQR
jgi:glycerol-3-phosphate dehydrogenase (NAD(P)+)